MANGHSFGRVDVHCSGCRDKIGTVNSKEPVTVYCHHCFLDRVLDDVFDNAGLTPNEVFCVECDTHIATHVDDIPEITCTDCVHRQKVINNT